MAFAGGVFTRLFSWTQDAQAGKVISPASFDADMNDMAAGLSNAILRDGTGTPTADVGWNGKRLTNLAAPTADGDALGLGLMPAAAVSRALGFTPRQTFAASAAGANTSINGNNIDAIALSAQFTAKGTNLLAVSAVTINDPSGNATEVYGTLQLLDITNNAVLSTGQPQGCFLTTVATAGGNVNPFIGYPGLVVGNLYRVDLLLRSTGAVATTAKYTALGVMNG